MSFESYLSLLTAPKSCRISCCRSLVTNDVLAKGLPYKEWDGDGLSVFGLGIANEVCDKPVLNFGVVLGGLE